MREIQVNAFCDLDHDEKVPATIERTVSIDGSDVVVLDLCDEHDSEVFTIVLVAMERGAVVQAPPEQPKQRAKRAGRKNPHHERRYESEYPTDPRYRTCPDCGFVSVSRSALGQHVSVRHQKGLSDYPEIAIPKPLPQ